MAQPPRFFIFHGEDEFTQKETLSDLRSRLGGDPGMVELNTTYYVGRTVRMDELLHTCRSLPFMSERRLVIVEGLLDRLSGKERQRDRETLLDYLPQLPPTTRLILMEKKTLPPGNPFVKLATGTPTGYVRAFNVPQGRLLEQWINQRVSAQGGSILPTASSLLASKVGQDLRLLGMEIEKLISYTGPGRPIEPADVELLTPYGSHTSIFELVDAIGQQRRQAASLLLRKKIENGEEPLYLLAMIIRQFRLLIQVKEKLNQGFRSHEISDRVKIHRFVAGKLVNQAANFSLDQLENIYRRLLEIDVSIKTGRVEPVVALDTLVVELAL